MDVAKDVRLPRDSEQVWLQVEYSLRFVNQLKHQCLAYSAHLHQVVFDQSQIRYFMPVL